MGHPLTTNRITAALVVAVLADCIQLPLNMLTLTGAFAIPSKACDILVDMVAFALTVALVGFHWVLLPTAFLEAVPLLDTLPLWTACVALVIYRRKQELARTGQDAARSSSASAGFEEETLLLMRDQREPRRVTATVVRDVKEG